ncbi:MAG: hypothetical protein ACAH21_13885, partial [Ramlibacter sp.]
LVVEERILPAGHGEFAHAQVSNPLKAILGRRPTMGVRIDDPATAREAFMNHLSLNTVKNVVIGVTLSLAGLASWALTDYRAPIIESAAAHSQPG